MLDKSGPLVRPSPCLCLYLGVSDRVKQLDDLRGRLDGISWGAEGVRGGQGVPLER